MKLSRIFGMLECLERYFHLQDQEKEARMCREMINSISKENNLPIIRRRGILRIVYQCPSCGKLEPLTSKIVDKFDLNKIFPNCKCGRKL